MKQHPGARHPATQAGRSHRAVRPSSHRGSDRAPREARYPGHDAAERRREGGLQPWPRDASLWLEGRAFRQGARRRERRLAASRVQAAVGPRVGVDALCAATDAAEQFIRERENEVRAMYLLWFLSIDPSADYRSNIANVHRAQRRDAAEWVRAGQRSGDGRSGRRSRARGRAVRRLDGRHHLSVAGESAHAADRDVRAAQVGSQAAPRGRRRGPCRSRSRGVTIAGRGARWPSNGGNRARSGA